jgi:transposase InsO family protein
MRVSVRAYHAYARGKTYALSPQQAAPAALVKETCYRHRRRYGARRIAAELKAQGQRAGRCAVRTLMRRQELQATAPLRFRPRTTDPRHTVAPSANLLLDAENAPQQPRQVIVGDITCLPLPTGKWGYPAGWRDQFTKRVVGRAVEARMTEELVINAFSKAVASGSVECGTITHTDQGSQYVATNFRGLLQAHGRRQSMSRRGNCYDNAQAESFFSRYKAEL